MPKTDRMNIVGAGYPADDGNVKIEDVLGEFLRADSGDWRKEMIEQIKRHEGSNDYRVYEDSTGNLTAGYGHKLLDHEIAALDTFTEERDGERYVSPEWASEMLNRDVANAEQHAREYLGPVYDELEPARKAAVVNMAFNLGRTGLMGFEKTRELLLEKDFEGASKEMLNSKWAGQVGDRATGLSRQIERGDLFY